MPWLGEVFLLILHVQYSKSEVTCPCVSGTWSYGGNSQSCELLGFIPCKHGAVCFQGIPSLTVTTQTMLSRQTGVLPRPTRTGATPATSPSPSARERSRLPARPRSSRTWPVVPVLRTGNSMENYTSSVLTQPTGPSSGALLRSASPTTDCDQSHLIFSRLTLTGITSRANTPSVPQPWRSPARLPRRQRRLFLTPPTVLVSQEDSGPLMERSRATASSPMA